MQDINLVEKRDKCLFCSPIPYLITEAKYWHVCLNINQSQLGRMMVILNRHIESPIELIDEEFEELKNLMNTLTKKINKIFNPDLINYAFLGNEVRHLHMHIVPRYKEPVNFSGIEFKDKDYGCNFGRNKFYPSKEILERISENLR